MTKYDSCTEYWLNTHEGTFRGEFEAMYRDIEDPWGCDAGNSSLNNRVFIDTIFDARHSFDRILDIGCGLGGIAKSIKVRNEGGHVLGIDVSATAVRKAKERHPDLDFRCHNILKSELQINNFDLVVLSEVLWYVLEDLPLFFLRVSNMMPEGGVLAMHQYFPSEQRFGRETIDGLSGFLNFMNSRTSFALKKMFTSHLQDGLVLLSTFQKEK